MNRSCVPVVLLEVYSFLFFYFSSSPLYTLSQIDKDGDEAIDIEAAVVPPVPTSLSTSPPPPPHGE